MIFAQYFQGAYVVGAVLGYGWVDVGQVFISLAGSTWGVVGTQYTVTAVTPDPAGNPGVPASYPNDTVTLNGGVGTIPASSLASAYLFQSGGYY